MSIVLITGGTGQLGTHVVERMRARGHEVRVLSRRARAGTHVGDLSTGAGIAEAARGADLIVHAATDFRRFGVPDPRQTEHLLAAAGDARHLLYVSIVGIDGIPMRYYRHKLDCERLVEAGATPYTILRATQFHDLLAGVLHTVQRLPLAPLPLDFRFQPVATIDVAARIADLVEGDPLGRADDFGGPEVLTLDRAVEIFRDQRGGPRRTVRLPVPGRIARAFRDGVNTCPEHADGVRTFAEFVASTSGNPYWR
ncbi:SDR family oxidoreductase [Nocardia takedensis]|uniref:SDR family oxidoreductase n=1 Tax=Nocardia takedensis TaxID=259390 RepID=UPI0002FB4FDF|nr:SDR family oxidoreductase [Nocardia takedensis]